MESERQARGKKVEEEEEEERVEDKKGNNGRGEWVEGWVEVSQYAIMKHEKEERGG